MLNSDFTTPDKADSLQSAVHFLTDGFTGNTDEFVTFARLTLPLTNRSMLPDWINLANQLPNLVTPETLARHWVPYAYDAPAHEMRWCLPQGRAVQPFYDEYISHCRQRLVNALISPRSSVEILLECAKRFEQFPDPAGFIFHLSRCGSTLVSGCLSELENCSVLSESPLLTDILLARNLNRENKKALLRFCLHLQGRPSLGQPHVIVKWNAWDIFYWELIREIWPNVPVLLLTRDPVEILASHAKSAGRHMSGDPALAHVHEVLAAGDDFTGLLDHRIKVLQGLMTKMLQVRGQSSVFLWDYALLDEAVLMEVLSRFKIEVAPNQSVRLRQRLRRHSKSPLVMFKADGAEKRRSLPLDHVDRILSSFSGIYKALIQRAHK